jgi:hypothetical protein
MRRNVLLTFAGIFTVLGAALLAASFLVVGINDGEWRNISQTGEFSRPNELVWTPWLPNEDSVQPFPGRRLDGRTVGLAEVRRGDAKGLLFDFTVYEGRAILGDVASTVPAIGPGWGAHYHSGWAVGSIGVAAICLLLAFKDRKRP